jgi:hypothetical protein
MAETIKKSDIIEGKPFEEIATEITKTLDALEKYDTKIVSIAKHLKGDLADANAKTLKGIKEVTDAEIKAEKLLQEKMRTQQQSVRLSETERRANEAKAKSEKKNTQDLENAYKRLAKSTTELKNKSKELGATMLELERSGRKNTDEYRKLAHQYSAVTRAAQQGDAELKKLDKTVGDNFRNVGNYESALGGLNSMLAKLGITMSAGMLLRDGLSVVTDFGSENARLSAILQKTTEETMHLQKQQRELGASTKFTAAEVASLQIELAKLGFNETQIEQSTASVLNLALAAGTDLANASMVAASTLRAFELEASEMTRVNNVMAAGFVTSGLDIENFRESMKYVAPVAKAAGVSIEETTAMLAALADSGIKGSTAGTSLRRILTDMAATGKPAQQALQELTSKGLTLTDAFDEVGRTAQTSLLILGNNMDKVSTLTEKYNDAEGTLDKMASTMSNTLGGAMQKLRSAYEEQILRLNDMSKAGSGLKSTLEFLANNLGTIFSVIGKVVRAFLIYKSVQLSLIAIEKARAFSIKSFGNSLLASIPLTKQYAAAQQQAAVASQQAGTAATNAGRSMMAIPWIAIIGMLYEVGKVFLDIASGAKQAREMSELYDKQVSAAAKRASNVSTKRSKELNNEIADIRRKAKTEQEANKAIAERLNNEEAFLKTSIKKANQLKEEIKQKAEILKAEKSMNFQLTTTDEDTKKRLANIMRGLGMTNDEIYDFNGAINALSRDKALGFLTAKTGVLNEELKVLHDELGNVSEQLKDANVPPPPPPPPTPDGATKSQREINTEFKRTNDYISEQLRLLKEIETVREGVSGKSRQKEIDSAIRLEVQAIEQSGEIQAEAIEEMIKIQYDLQRKQAEELTEFEISEIKAKQQREKQSRLQDLQDKRDDLIKGAKGDASALKQIEANYQTELENLKNEEFEREEDLATRIALLREKLKAQLFDINEEENSDISDANDEFIEAQIRFYDKQNEIAKDAATKRVEQQKEMMEALQKIEEGISKAIQEQIDRRIEILGKQADAAAKQADILKGLAESGNIDAQQSLKEQLDYQREIQREQIRLEKQKQNVEAVSAGLKVFLSEIEQGKNPASALASAFVSTNVLVNTLKGLSFFEKGTDNAPEGLAVVDEKGKELITDKNGNIKALGTDKGARMTYLNKGDKVYTANQTASLLDQINLSNRFGRESTTKTNDLKVLQSGLKSIENAIQNKGETQIHWETLTMVSRTKRNGVTTTNRFVNR